MEALWRLGRIVLDGRTLGELLEEVATIAADTLDGVDEASVTLMDEQGGPPRTVGFTGSLAVQLDERQYALGFGPCLDAASGGEVVHIPDTAREGRYAGFSGLAARAGIRSVTSIPMPVPQRVLGALNLYSARQETFDGPTRARARGFAAHAAVLLLNAELVESRTALARNLREAMASRAVIEQAKGIVMARLGGTPEEAFAYLAHQSQQSNRKLRELAAELVAATGRQSP